MLFYHIVLLAVVQGITEFVPVSSSGHLILLHNILDPEALKNAESNRLMDIAVHIGTLFAVIVYFYRDVLRMLKGLLDLRKYKSQGLTENSRLMIHVLVGSLPIIIIGSIIFIAVDPAILANPKIIFYTTIIFGLLLWFADAKNPELRKVEHLTLRDSILIGLMQCFALIPGVSRSGITMTASRFLGLARTEAARYSILLSIIATSAVGAAGIVELIKEGNDGLISDALIAAGLTFVTGFLVITFLMEFLKRFSMKVFAIYRLLLGAVLFYFFILPDL